MENSDSVYKSLFERTKKVFESDSHNYRQVLAYRLLNCARANDIETFLNIFLRAINHRSNKKEIIEKLEEALFKSNKDECIIEPKKVMYSIILGIMGGEKQ